jgi:predicted MPP superfamily phosphohydrolase
MDLVFSDIHADVDALDIILEIAASKDFIKKYGSFDRIINLGDLLERGNNPREVLAKLSHLKKNYSIVSVMGNHDEAFLYKRPVSGSSVESWSAHQALKENDLEFFVQNKDNTFGQQQFIDAKNNLVCVHGGPLDPKKITPKNAYDDETWLYQKTWQRLSEEDYEFFSYSGYNYKASSAFGEAKNHADNFVILCGHQHKEAVLVQNEQIHDVFSQLEVKHEKASDFTLEKREIEIEKSNNYLIRLGLGGPSGYYGVGSAQPHFGIVQYDPKKVTLFSVNKSL